MLQHIQEIDDFVLDWIGRLHTPILNRLMILFSLLGSKGVVWFAISILCLFDDDMIIIGVGFIVALGLTTAVGEGIIKHAVGRIRPCHKLEYSDLLTRRPDYYSFPSGHTASSFSVFAVAFWRCDTTTWIGILLLATLIGFSRIYLRVHYLTDVLCGIILGIFCGSTAVLIMNRLVQFAVRRS